jgi:hypothetical protein
MALKLRRPGGSSPERPESQPYLKIYYTGSCSNTVKNIINKRNQKKFQKRKNLNSCAHYWSSVDVEKLSVSPVSLAVVFKSLCDMPFMS